MYRSIVTVFTLSFLAASSQAALIAEYNFDAGVTNAAGAQFSPLNIVGESPDLSGGSYNSDGVAANRLEIAGPGGAPDFTVSVWVKNPMDHTGDFQGIFANNTSSGAANSFQLDSHNGNYRLASTGGATTTIGPVVPQEWTNLVLQKFGGNNGRLFLNGTQVGSDLGFNPGGLQNFRIGINRNSDNNNSFFGQIDNVQIWDDSTQDAAAIHAAGPGLSATGPISAFEYDAFADVNFDGNWDETHQFFNPGERNFALTNVTQVPTGDFDAPAAFRFNGVDSKADLGPGNTFEGSTGNPTNNSASFELLFKPETVAGQQVLLDLGGTTDGMSLTINDGMLQYIVKDNANVGGVVSDITGLVRDELLHVVATVDMEESSVSLFVNGKLVGSGAFAGADWAGGDGDALGSFDNNVGGHNSVFGDLNSYSPFNGDIALFRLYGGALTQGDVNVLVENFRIVPEPASALLLGMAGLGLIRRRRRVA